MDKKFNGLERIDVFAQEVLSLISKGKKESIGKIIEEIGKKNVVHYLWNKYKDSFSISYTDSHYSVDDWEEAYYQFSYISEGDACRKWGICNENDGLLLLVSLTLEALRHVIH